MTKVIAPRVRPRAVSGTMSRDRSPKARRRLQMLPVPREAAKQLVGNLGDELRPRGADDLRHRILGYLSRYRWLIAQTASTLAGSAWAMARRRRRPSASTMSTAHQSASRGTASRAVADSVAWKSSEEASTSLGLRQELHPLVRRLGPMPSETLRIVQPGPLERQCAPAPRA